MDKTKTKPMVVSPFNLWKRQPVIVDNYRYVAARCPAKRDTNMASLTVFIAMLDRIRGELVGDKSEGGDLILCKAVDVIGDL